ncbi:MAG: DegV family protein [Lachnospiraceae bacterium]|nr:DegV family protein [Lachnospiraceae bacterium]
MTEYRDYKYQIFTDATSDLSDELLDGLPHLEVIPMTLEIGGREYIYGLQGDISVEEFYRLQRAGNFASTSQINPSVFTDYFEPYLKQGKDVLYLCFSSGLSGTLQSAQISMKELREKYPERIIICVDTLCASVGEALLVREALKRQSEGMGISELFRWVANHRLQVCHWFTVDTFDHLKHGGRVSAVSAAVGTVLQIKPLIHVDESGALKVVEKPRGRKKAISSQLARMEQGWQPEISKSVVVGHGDSPEAAGMLMGEIALKFPEAEIYTADIGPIIGAHTGPGMLALIYMGNNR